MKIVVLHSAGTTPAAMAKLVGPLPPGWAALYPQAKNNLRWDHLGNNDVPALMALGGDFICGYSSGAFMAMRMTRQRQYKGAMMLAGGLLHPYLSLPLPFPCPTMLVHGTADRQVPYDGVEYAYESGLDEALALKRLLAAGPQSGALIPNTQNDGCRAYYDDWAGAFAPVRLYTVVNGGHTWPGSKLNAFGLGRTCMDFSATAEMVKFFGGLA